MGFRFWVLAKISFTKICVLFLFCPVNIFSVNKNYFEIFVEIFNSFFLKIKKKNQQQTTITVLFLTISELPSGLPNSAQNHFFFFFIAMIYSITFSI